MPGREKNCTELSGPESSGTEIAGQPMTRWEKRTLRSAASMGSSVSDFNSGPAKLGVMTPSI